MGGSQEERDDFLQVQDSRNYVPQNMDDGRSKDSKGVLDTEEIVFISVGFRFVLSEPLLEQAQYGLKIRLLSEIRAQPWQRKISDIQAGPCDEVMRRAG
jgi:hypothetical protein